jgi:uncharacterized membrane protein YagU involved in acid resistance
MDKKILKTLTFENIKNNGLVVLEMLRDVSWVLFLYCGFLAIVLAVSFSVYCVYVSLGIVAGIIFDLLLFVLILTVLATAGDWFDLNHDIDYDV